MKKFSFFFVLIGIAAVRTATPHDESSFVKPCGSDIDLTCVRKYFTEKASCSVVTEANHSPLYEDNLPIYLPMVNLTVVTTKTTLSKLDGKIEEFYYNERTGNLVFSVKFEGIVCDAPDNTFAISQNGIEPLVFTENVKATYPVVLTAVIPARDGVTTESLKEAGYSARFPNSDADIVIGPKFTKSQDPVVQAVSKGLTKDLPSALMEIFRTKASFMFLAYLQNYICNFRLSPVLEKYDLSLLNSVKDLDVNDVTQFNQPCANSGDVTDCVRNYFQQHAHSCSMVQNVNDEPLDRGRFRIPVPSLNSTLYALWGRWTHGSLRGTIENFYINNQTGNLVMSVAFVAASIFTPQIRLSISQRGGENIDVTDYSTHIYPVTITAVIPISKGFTPEALRQSFVTGHLRQPSIFVIGPKYTQSMDQEMVAIVNNVFSHSTKIGQECLVTEAPPLFLSYLQKYICDFGIPI